MTFEKNDIQIDNLQLNDYTEFILLLSQLTTVGNITFDDFVKRYNDSKNITVVAKKDDHIIATGSIFIENKFIHSLGKVAHIEDVVVDANYRKTGVGSIVIQHLTEIAKKNNCYKAILDCDEKIVPFYEKHGYSKKGCYMAQYFQ